MSYLKTLKKVFEERRFRAVAWFTFAAYLVIYLLVTQFIVFSGISEGNPVFAFETIPNWTENIFRTRAPFLYESVGKVHLTPYITIFLSIPNIILGALLSAVVALNISISYFTFKRLGLSGRKGAATLIGTIPALLGGAACCVPTLIVVLGLQFTATLSALWSWFVPVSLILLFISLFWVLKHASKRLSQGNDVPKA